MAQKIGGFLLGALLLASSSAVAGEATRAGVRAPEAAAQQLAQAPKFDPHKMCCPYRDGQNADFSRPCSKKVVQGKWTYWGWAPPGSWRWLRCRKRHRWIWGWVPPGKYRWRRCNDRDYQRGKC